MNATITETGYESVPTATRQLKVVERLSLIPMGPTVIAPMTLLQYHLNRTAEGTSEVLCVWSRCRVACLLCVPLLFRCLCLSLVVVVSRRENLTPRHSWHAVVTCFSHLPLPCTACRVVSYRPCRMVPCRGSRCRTPTTCGRPAAPTSQRCRSSASPSASTSARRQCSSPTRGFQRFRCPRS